MRREWPPIVPGIRLRPAGQRRRQGFVTHLRVIEIEEVAGPVGIDDMETGQLPHPQRIAKLVEIPGACHGHHLIERVEVGVPARHERAGVRADLAHHGAAGRQAERDASLAHPAGGIDKKYPAVHQLPSDEEPLELGLELHPVGIAGRQPDLTLRHRVDIRKIGIVGRERPSEDLIVALQNHGQSAERRSRDIYLRTGQMGLVPLEWAVVVAVRIQHQHCRARQRPRWRERPGVA